jgi:hypothetical protein
MVSIRFALVSLFYLVVLAAPAYAERVITIDQVANRVKVRHRPDIASPAIGSLRPDESAQLLESLPYWYHIQLDNGVPGYVSRSYTRTLSGAEGDGALVRLGYWNIGGRDAAQACAVIAQIIDSHFDAVAVAGLKRSETGDPYRALLDALGSGWAGLRAEAGESANESAVLYRTALIRPAADWKELVVQRSEPDEAASVAAAEIAFGRFEAPLNKSSMGIDFLFGIYHAPETAQSGFEGIDNIISSVRVAHPLERDVIVAGTFNASAADLQKAVEGRVRTRGQGSVLGAGGELTSNLYDHMLIVDESATIETIDPPHVVDVRAAAGSNLDFFDKCGDHLPLLLRLRAGGPDDD